MRNLFSLHVDHSHTARLVVFCHANNPRLTRTLLPFLPTPDVVLSFGQNARSPTRDTINV